MTSVHVDDRINADDVNQFAGPACGTYPATWNNIPPTRRSLSAKLINMSDVTTILSRIQQGDRHASNELLPLVYEELRKLASQRMASEKPGQTLQATALRQDSY